MKEYTDMDVHVDIHTKKKVKVLHPYNCGFKNKEYKDEKGINIFDDSVWDRPQDFEPKEHKFETREEIDKELDDIIEKADNRNMKKWKEGENAIIRNYLLTGTEMTYKESTAGIHMCSSPAR